MSRKIHWDPKTRKERTGPRPGRYLSVRHLRGTGRGVPLWPESRKTALRKYHAYHRQAEIEARELRKAHGG